jgi:hypothetical protein
MFLKTLVCGLVGGCCAKQIANGDQLLHQYRYVCRTYVSTIMTIVPELSETIPQSEPSIKATTTTMTAIKTATTIASTSDTTVTIIATSVTTVTTLAISTTIDSSAGIMS